MSQNKRKSLKKSPQKINNSSRDSDESDDPTAKLIIKVRNMKQNFIGDYIGRELVKHECFPQYKDIIIVDKDEEIIPTLDEIYDILHPQLATTWLGITRSTIDDEVQSYKLWVNLNGTPIGKHQFQLRAIKANESGIELKLKVMDELGYSSLNSVWDDNSHSSFEFKDMSTYHNICEITKFSGVLIMSIITIAGNILWYCGDYSLKFTHELTKLIQVMTPIIFGILDFMSKCVGGFYWLIYMLWRGNSDRTPKYSYPAINPSQLAIMPGPSPTRRSYPVPKRYFK
ncbi:hypothetical protein PV327_002602 [Microctonus hyperodae]|uniref:Uncharacterized protein n=1 Tax=Microctonus hyperodae TaxID=165561 RepID=A0AA39KPA1_MICHY|nr:hypothetical protein PV327_002602 [Microctonus hyperodae]